MRDPETGKGGYVPSDMTYKEWKEIYVDKTSTMDEWNAKHVDKSAESGIINAYPGKSDSHQANEISQTIKAKVAEAESTVVRDIPSLSGWHEPIAYGEVESGLAEHVFDLKTGRCKITLLDTVFSDPTELASRLRVDYETHLSFEVESYQSLVAHELGHNAHTVLALKRAGLEYGKPLTRIEEAIFEREYNEISKEVYLAAFSNESFDEIQSICKTELGTMTYCNPHELIAQSFGNYYFGKKKSNVAKRIVKMFKRELR